MQGARPDNLQTSSRLEADGADTENFPSPVFIYDDATGNRSRDCGGQQELRAFIMNHSPVSSAVQKPRAL